MHGSELRGLVRRDGTLAQEPSDPGDYLDGTQPPSAGTFGWRLAREARQIGVPPSKLVIDVLQGLARKMFLDGMQAGPATDNPDIPAGYTYLGQLVAHDLIFSDSPTLASPSDGNARPWTTAAFDLDCLYRGGPFRSPLLYQQRETRDPHAIRLKLRVGYTAGNPYLRDGAKAGTPALSKDPQPLDLAALPATNEACNATDIHRIPADSPRQCPVEPLVGDARNDDNLILSQLVVLFHRFHNRIIDVIAASERRPSDYDIFEIARSIVVNAYRAVIRNDYLEKILEPEVWEAHAALEELDAFGVFGKRLSQDPATPLPMEFWMAAFRVGHAMVQPLYALNSTLPITQSSLKAMLTFRRWKPSRNTTVPGCPITNDWIVDWDLFFPEKIGTTENHARRFRPWVTTQLYSLKGLDHRDDAEMNQLYERFGGVPFRDLARGYLRGLPNGQHLADLLGVERLTREELIGNARSGLGGMSGRSHKNPLASAPVDAIGALAEDTPLFYYILREAEVRHDGKRLGPLGSTIVAKVMFALLAKGSSTRHHPETPHWTNRVFGVGGTPMTLRRIVEFVNAPNRGLLGRRPPTQASV